jgi:predicted kinase
VCEDQQDLLDNVVLFEELCKEYGCFQAPRQFCSKHARFLYFGGLWNHPDVKPYADFKARVVLMSGLPGVGKDHWIKEHLPDWPVVSLDAIRRELDISPTRPQGRVIQAAQEQARNYLREGVGFVWNATNISRQIRAQRVRLFRDYGARIRMVYLEVSPDRLDRQNREREYPVPEKAIGRFLGQWDVPDPYEAHCVEYVIEGGSGFKDCGSCRN